MEWRSVVTPEVTQDLLLRLEQDYGWIVVVTHDQVEHTLCIVVESPVAVEMPVRANTWTGYGRSTLVSNSTALGERAEGATQGSEASGPQPALVGSFMIQIPARRHQPAEAPAEGQDVSEAQRPSPNVLLKEFTLGPQACSMIFHPTIRSSKHPLTRSLQTEMKIPHLPKQPMSRTLIRTDSQAKPEEDQQEKTQGSSRTRQI